MRHMLYCSLSNEVILGEYKFSFIRMMILGLEGIKCIVMVIFCLEVVLIILAILIIVFKWIFFEQYLLPWMRTFSSLFIPLFGLGSDRLLILFIKKVWEYIVEIIELRLVH